MWRGAYTRVRDSRVCAHSMAQHATWRTARIARVQSKASRDVLVPPGLVRDDMHAREEHEHACTCQGVGTIWYHCGTIWYHHATQGQNLMSQARCRVGARLPCRATTSAGLMKDGASAVTQIEASCM